MAAVFDNSSTGNSNSSGSSLSWSHTLGGIGNFGLIIVGIEAEFFSGGGFSNSVTFNGVSMTLIGRNQGSGSHNCFVEMWALWGASIPAAGTYTVSASWGSSSNSRAAGAMSFFGLLPQAAEASTSVSGNGTNPLATNLTTLTQNALLVSVYGSQNGPNATSSTGDTRAFNSAPGSSEVSECDGFYRIVVTPASSSVSISASNPEGEALVLGSFAISLQGGGGIFPILT